MKKYFPLILFFLSSCIAQQSPEKERIVLSTNIQGKGNAFIIDFVKGKEFNHPCFAIWVEDMEGIYLETLLVTRYVAKGVYGHGQIAPGKWDNKPGPVRRPATLPYWAHKRNIKAEDGLFIPSPENPVPDGITTATPAGSFRLNTSLSVKKSGKIRVLLEINQAWDSNNYWYNGKFPDDIDYYGSLQPSLVYAGTIDLSEPDSPVFLNPIGHGHPSGKDGRLYTDLTSFTSAREIIYSVNVSLQ